MRRLRLCLGLVFLLSATGNLFGQAGATESILGIVTDTTGAVVPKVQITITNEATNVPFHTITSSTGDYVAPTLAPETYSVTAKLKGFQASETTGINLAVDQKVRVNITLKPGEVSQTTRVTANAVTLDSASSTAPMKAVKLTTRRISIRTAFV